MASLRTKMVKTIYLARERVGNDCEDAMLILRNTPKIYSDGSIGAEDDGIACLTTDALCEDCDTIFPEAKLGKIYVYELKEVKNLKDFVNKEL